MDRDGFIEWFLVLKKIPPYLFSQWTSLSHRI